MKEKESDEVAEREREMVGKDQNPISPMLLCGCMYGYVSMLCLHMRIETEITAHNHES